MSMKDKAKEIARKQIKKKIRRIALIVIKPFLPFIILVVGITFAVCIVVDGVFVTEADMSLVEKAERGELTDKEYMDWLKLKNDSNSSISSGDGLISKGMFIWPIPDYTTITSHFGMRVHPITRRIQIT